MGEGTFCRQKGRNCHPASMRWLSALRMFSSYSATLASKVVTTHSFILVRKSAHDVGSSAEAPCMTWMQLPMEPFQRRVSMM